MHDEPLVLNIEKPAFHGLGLGRIEGKTIFVPRTVPGDVVSARIVRDKGDYAFAETIHLVQPSSLRREPECPVFGTCGGCSYLNVAYGDELALKREILSDCMIRIGKFNEGLLPVIEMISGDRFNYRSHCAIKTANGAAGFYREDSRELVPFPEGGCLLLAAGINEYIRGQRWTEGDIRIASSAEGEIISSLDGKETIRERERDLIFDRSILGFFQANRLLRGRMLDLVAEQAAPLPSEHILDVACGVGFFTLFLAKKCRSALGIDVDRRGIRYAKSNARINGIGNAVFRAMPAAEINPHSQPADLVVADPPRAGLSRKTRGALKVMRPRRIVYMSCDPPSLARDAGDFCSAGYALGSLILIDMFPGTYHMEAAALFERIY